MYKVVLETQGKIRKPSGELTPNPRQPPPPTHPPRHSLLSDFPGIVALGHAAWPPELKCTLASNAIKDFKYYDIDRLHIICT